MTVSLGGIALDESLALTGLKNRQPVAVNVQQTIAGRAVAQVFQVQAGEPLVLEARQDGDRIYGRYTGSQIDQIRALWNGAAQTLVHHLGTWQVVITAIDVYDVQDYADPGDTDIYVGTVTMVEV